MRLSERTEEREIEPQSQGKRCEEQEEGRQKWGAETQELKRKIKKKKNIVKGESEDGMED